MGKKDKGSLGRALIKDRFAKNRHKRHVEDDSMLHTTEVNDGYDWGRLNLQSVTAESSLQEFLSTAELADKEFAAEKLNIHYVKSAPSHVLPPTSQPDFSEPLTCPRRPQWLPGVGAEEQSAKEKEAFLEWRKHLNELQEKLGAALTPYERNLELWKQLWRTLERSDLVLLLLDARNPLLFRSADLEKYASESKCKCVLLLNKADLIGEYERECWAKYFDKEGVQVVFFSADKTTKEKEDKITEEDKESEDETTDSAYSESEEVPEIISQNDIQCQTNNTISQTDADIQCQTNNTISQTDANIELFKRQVRELDEAVMLTGAKLGKIQASLNKLLENIKLGISNEIGREERVSELKNSSDILDRQELLQVLKNFKGQLKLKNAPHLTVGMIGYPNVGKSSTVNVLMQTKKVSVSSMPGHTRHIQSLVLDEDIHILDCPGLVLPAYAVTPDLLLTAVLPIDQMRSWDAAVCRLCELVPRRVMERQYGLLLPRNDEEPNALHYKEVLTAHAYNRGFMTAAGQADASRSARLLLKDASCGRLRWSVLPPGCERRHEEVATASQAARRKPTPREARLVEGWSRRADEIDKSFFGAGKGAAHVKGRPIAGLSGVGGPASAEAGDKPWKKEKKHVNKNKREKLRRVYAHLDQH